MSRFLPSSLSSRFPERLDPAHDHEEIVLARQGEDGVDEIVPRALFAQVDFQPVGEEGEEVGASADRTRDPAQFASDVTAELSAMRLEYQSI